MIPRSYDVIVIGGGASGLMAAGRAGELGKKVLLLEKNKRLGEKLRITGGGRCNITNAEDDTRLLLQAYGAAEQYLYSLFAQFGVKDTFNFFESRGVPLVVEARKRAFPKSEKAADVVQALAGYAKKSGVEVKTGAAVTDILRRDGEITGVVCEGETYTAKEYIFCTGSISHPETGSTGDGFTWLKNFGHTIAPPTPSIVPLKVKDEWSKLLTGMSVEPMKITFYVEGKKAFSKLGKILFTHFGISGPLILNSATAVSDLLYEGVVTATIDLFPTMDMGSAERNIIATFDSNKNKALKNVLKQIVPPGTTRGILPLLHGIVDEEKKVHSITKDERKQLLRLLKALPLTIEGLMGFDRAVIADGGVPLDEVDTRTMRSKKVSNLFLTGDLLHINRPSGGYSLQLCWSSGFVAGSQAAVQ